MRGSVPSDALQHQYHFKHFCNSIHKPDHHRSLRASRLPSVCGVTILHRDDSHTCGYGRGARWTYFYDMQLSTEHLCAAQSIVGREEFGETGLSFISVPTVAASLSLGVFIANGMINPGRQPKLERLELLRA